MGLYVKISFLFDSVTKGSTKSIYSVGASQGMIQRKKKQEVLYTCKLYCIIELQCNHDGEKSMSSTKGEEKVRIFLCSSMDEISSYDKIYPRSIAL